MGFSYVGKKLCCDFCGTPGARKVHCPIGYCPPAAACPTCRKTHATKFHIAAHTACFAGREAIRNRTLVEINLLEDGHLLRRAALSEGNLVKVWFHDKHKSAKAYLMPHEVYKAFPLMTPVTLTDYKNYAGCEFIEVPA
jgi:hypothetical protein